MDENEDYDYGIDWLTGEYTYKRQILKEALKEGRGLNNN
jgi:hypothetical protein